MAVWRRKEKSSERAKEKIYLKHFYQFLSIRMHSSKLHIKSFDAVVSRSCRSSWTSLGNNVLLRTPITGAAHRTVQVQLCQQKAALNCLQSCFILKTHGP